MNRILNRLARVSPGKFFAKVFMISFAVVVVQSCSFSKKTARKIFEKSEHETFDLVIVPGIPFENGQWGRTMKARVYWSKYLYDRGIAKNIMYSGSAVYSPYYESKIMALYAEAIGIPKSSIFTESRAEHSTENIYYSYKKAKLLGFKKIAVASDHFQTKLLRRYVRRRVSPEVALFPFVMDTLKMIEPSMIDPVIDYDQAFKPGFVSLMKREGLFKRLRGALGGNVNKDEYYMGPPDASRQSVR